MGEEEVRHRIREKDQHYLRVLQSCSLPIDDDEPLLAHREAGSDDAKLSVYCSQRSIQMRNPFGCRSLQRPLLQEHAARRA